MFTNFLYEYKSLFLSEDQSPSVVRIFKRSLQKLIREGNVILQYHSMLRILIRGIWCLFDPWIRDPGWVKKIRIRIRDQDLGSYFWDLGTIFWVKILKFFDADPGHGIRIQNIRILDPGWKKFGSVINIPDPQNCFVSLCTFCVGQPRWMSLLWQSEVGPTLFRNWK